MRTESRRSLLFQMEDNQNKSNLLSVGKGYLVVLAPIVWTCTMKLMSQEIVSSIARIGVLVSEVGSLFLFFSFLVERRIKTDFPKKKKVGSPHALHQVTCCSSSKSTHSQGSYCWHDAVSVWVAPAFIKSNGHFTWWRLGPGATQTKTLLCEQYDAGDCVDLLDDADFPASVKLTAFSFSDCLPGLSAEGFLLCTSFSKMAKIKGKLLSKIIFVHRDQWGQNLNKNTVKQTAKNAPKIWSNGNATIITSPLPCFNNPRLQNSFEFATGRSWSTMAGRLRTDSDWSGTFQVARVTLHDYEIKSQAEHGQMNSRNWQKILWWKRRCQYEVTFYLASRIRGCGMI